MFIHFTNAHNNACLINITTINSIFVIQKKTEIGIEHRVRMSFIGKEQVLLSKEFDSKKDAEEYLFHLSQSINDCLNESE